MDLKKELLALKEAYNWSYNDIGRLSGVSSSTIHRICTTGQNTTPGMVAKIEKFINNNKDTK